MAVAAPTAGCPVRDDYDVFSVAYSLDPHPILRDARENTPVFYASRTGMYVVARHADVKRLIGDAESFSSEHFVWAPEPPAKYADQLPNGYAIGVGQLASMDPPAHTRLKRLAMKGFTPRAVTAHRADVREIAYGLIDAMLAERSRKANLMTSFADRLPAMTIASILGAPVEDYTRFRLWAATGVELILAQPQGERLDEVSVHMIEFDRFLRDLFAARRAELGEDILSSLIRAREEDDALSEAELVGTVASMLLGGSDSVGSAIGHLIWGLLRTAAMGMVRDDRSLVPAAVEESIRFTQSSHGPTRDAKRDVEIAGVTIPAGAPVQVAMKSANRDAEVFERPDDFDVRRPDADKALHYGFRTHYCLGASLARIELQETLNAFLDRVLELSLVGDGERDYRPVAVLTSPLTNVSVAW